MERRGPLIEYEVIMINAQNKLAVDIMEHAMNPFLVMKSNWHDEMKWETDEDLIVSKEVDEFDNDEYTEYEYKDDCGSDDYNDYEKEV